MLDNGSRDGSAEAARAHPAVDEVIALDERRGKALNDSELLRRARGRYALLLNEDSELLPGATLALYEALEERPDSRLRGRGAAAARRQPQPCAWRFPTAATALAGALFLHRLLTVQSTGEQTREVDWCQSAALLVSAARRPAGRLPGPGLLRLLRRGRLRPAAARRGLAQRLRARAPWRSTTSSSRPTPCPSGGSSKWRATATCTCASTTRPAGRARGALADRLGLRAARAGGARAARPLRRGATGAT